MTDYTIIIDPPPVSNIVLVAPQGAPGGKGDKGDKGDPGDLNSPFIDDPLAYYILAKN